MGISFAVYRHTNGPVAATTPTQFAWPKPISPVCFVYFSWPGAETCRLEVHPRKVYELMYNISGSFLNVAAAHFCTFSWGLKKCQNWKETISWNYNFSSGVRAKHVFAQRPKDREALFWPTKRKTGTLWTSANRGGQFFVACQHWQEMAHDGNIQKTTTTNDIGRLESITYTTKPSRTHTQPKPKLWDNRENSRCNLTSTIVQLSKDPIMKP